MEGITGGGDEGIARGGGDKTAGEDGDGTAERGIERMTNST